MGYELHCGDVVTGCDGVVHGDSQEEVLTQAAAHAAEAHGITEVDAATEQAMVEAIRSS